MGRAIGETMAVQMVIGNITAKIPNSLVTGATTMPAAIVTQLPEATSPAHRAGLIMVAFLLLIITLILIATVRLTTSGQHADSRSRKPPSPANRTVAAASFKQGDA
jgi:ABC-type phosphate transport system permease subunit